MQRDGVAAPAEGREGRQLRELFETRNMGENAGDSPNKFWGTFIVNPNNPHERYLVTSPQDKKSDAAKFTEANNRIASLWLQSKQEAANAGPQED